MAGARHSIFVFDAYGTVFDVHAAVARVGPALGVDGVAFSALWRAKQLEYSWIRTMAGRYQDFWHITQEALDYCFQRFPAANRSARSALLEAYRTLDAYPEVKAELVGLKLRGCHTAILSNGTEDMLRRATESAGLADCFDAILSVDRLRRFKTVPETYRLVLDRFRVDPGEVSFQSSNGWDIAGASAFGFRTVWINRGNLPVEYPDLAPGLILPSLSGLASMMDN